MVDVRSVCVCVCESLLAINTLYIFISFFIVFWCGKHWMRMDAVHYHIVGLDCEPMYRYSDILLYTTQPPIFFSAVVVNACERTAKKKGHTTKSLRKLSEERLIEFISWVSFTSHSHGYERHFGS